MVALIPGEHAPLPRAVGTDPQPLSYCHVLGEAWLADLRNHDRSRALWTALGINRLNSATTVVARQTSLLAVWRSLDTSSQRFAFKTALLSTVGLFGFLSFLHLGPSDPHQSFGSFVLDSVVKTFQLFTFQYSPRMNEVPWLTQVARLVLPATALFVGAITVSRRVSRSFFTWRSSRDRRHAVLIGSSDVVVALAHAYRQKLYRPVVAIVPADPGTAMTPIEKAGADLLVGDPSAVSTLRRAGVQRATALIAPDDIAVGVVSLGTAVAQIGQERSPDLPPLPFVVRLAHNELRDLAIAHLTPSLSASSTELHVYVRERTIARGLLSRYPADWGMPPGPHDLHVAIFGFGEMGSELLLQLARIAIPSSGRRTILTIVDRDADAQKERLLAEYPNLTHCAELRFKKADVRFGAIAKEQFDDWLLGPLPATSIYVCCGDDHVNLSAALGLRHAYRHSGVISPPMFVYQRTDSAQVRALPQIHGRGIDTLRIVEFGGIEDEADPFFLVEEEIDELARQLHTNYLTTVSTPGPALAPWPKLEETYRAANRSLADHLQVKLRSLGLHAQISSSDPQVAPLSWNDAEKSRIESLAQQEHERWCRDRWLRGWTYGNPRDDGTLMHPDLVPYDQLGEGERNKDRQIISDLPEQLAPLGIGLKRDKRIGIWFESDKVAAPQALVSELVSRLERKLDEDRQLHLQLVLPLRTPAEWSIAVTLASRGDVGLDVAITRYPGLDDLGATTDRSAIPAAIAAADRAFVLGLAREDSAAGDSVRLAALCSVSDTVLLACELADQASGLLSQVNEGHKQQIELVALRF